MTTTQTIVEGDCLEVLAGLPAKSVQCVMTSPPYWGLRSYGFKADDPARKKMIGMEPTFDRHLWNLVRVFREVRRVLRDDGTLWLNYGDSHANDEKWGGGQSSQLNRRASGVTPCVPHKGCRTGLPSKNLIGMAWRIAFALQADGWILRRDIIWHKRSPMPESARDRPTKAHEYVFLFSKSPRYFYDQEAGRESTRGSDTHGKGRAPHEMPKTMSMGEGIKNNVSFSAATWGAVQSRNARSVWTLSSEPFAGAHFATFPTELVARCLRPGTSLTGCCSTCGAPWRRIIERERIATRPGTGSKVSIDRRTGESLQCSYRPWAAEEVGNRDPKRHVTHFQTTGWQRGCEHEVEPVSCAVLDPFAGSGTVGVVCRRMGLNFIGIELSPEYAAMARKRIAASDDREPAAPEVEGQMEFLLDADEEAEPNSAGRVAG